MQNNTEEAAKLKQKIKDKAVFYATQGTGSKYDFEAGANFVLSILSDASKEEPKGLEELKQNFLKWYQDYEVTYSYSPSLKFVFDWFLENLSGVSNTQSSDAVFTARDMENFAAKMLLTFDKSRTLKDELNIFCEKDMEGITPVEKEPCKCLCHISEGVTMHMFPCCEETNKKLPPIK